MTQVDFILKADLEIPSKRLPPKIRNPWGYYPAQAVSLALIQKATELADGGQPAEALTRLTDATRILRYLASEATSWNQWHDCQLYEQHVMQHIHAVSADDRITQEQLIAAVDVVERQNKSMGTASPLPANRTAVYSQLLLRYGPIWRLYEEKKLFNPPTRIADRSYSERWRLLRLLYLAGNPMLTQQQTPFDIQKNINRWAGSTSDAVETDLLHDPIAHGAAFFPGPQDELFHSYLNARRATIVILRLQAARRANGSFPSNLRHLVYGSDQRMPQMFHNESGDFTNWDSDAAYIEDIKTGLPFEYLPDGLGNAYLSNGDSNTRTFISPQQPVLRSSGAGSNGYFYPWSQNDGQVERFDSLTLESNRIVYVDGSIYPIVGPRSDSVESDNK